MPKAKMVAIILAIIALAVLIGIWGSNTLGPDVRQNDVETEADYGGLDVGSDDFSDGRPDYEGRELTGDEGETVDGARVLAPNEPARVTDQPDYFEGLEQMDGAVPGGRPATGTSGAGGQRSEMDRLLEDLDEEKKVENGQRSASGTAPRSTGGTTPRATGGSAAGSTQTNGGGGASASRTTPAGKGATTPGVRRPPEDMSELLDNIERQSQ